MSVSEAEVQMIDQYSKNIDMQDIGLFLAAYHKDHRRLENSWK